jgi:hypothetical protein
MGAYLAAVANSERLASTKGPAPQRDLRPLHLSANRILAVQCSTLGSTADRCV